MLNQLIFWLKLGFIGVKLLIIDVFVDLALFGWDLSIYVITG